MKKAFTLIELLIVVAIIAILAAIAVPNFLEAQTRAKVARVASDQRTYGTAIGTYQIDYSTYPLWYSPNASEGNPVVGKPTGVTQNINAALAAAANVTGNDLTKYQNLPTFAYKVGAAGVPPVSLTTPVSYLNTYVPDTFATAKQMTFGYVAGPAGPLIWSPGPDQVDQLWFTTEPSTANRQAEVIAFGGQSLPSPYLIAGPTGNMTKPTGAAGTKAFTYDSSNGTTSDGDVYRTQ